MKAKDDLIPFRVNFSKVESIPVEVFLKDRPFGEGVDVLPNGGVIYNPNHNDGVNSAVEDNPTKSSIDVSIDKMNSDYIDVYAILQRVNTVQPVVGTDGNPLLYAFKNEKGFKFNSKRDAELIKRDIRLVLDKFVNQYFNSIDGNVATVVIPSGNSLNNSFADWFMKSVECQGRQMKLYDGVLDKVSTDIVREEVLDDAGSEFCKWLGSMPAGKAFKIRKKLDMYLKDMDELHGRTFSYHYVRDPDIRNHMSLSMKLSKSPSIAAEFGNINECNVILLDDSISRGASMKEAYAILSRHYRPKSMTGLTLFSPVKRTI